MHPTSWLVDRARAALLAVGACALSVAALVLGGDGCGGGVRSAFAEGAAPAAPVPVAPVAPAPDTAPPVVPAAPAPVWTLDRAVAAGLLDVRGEAPASYQSVVLVLTNRSKAALTVDVAGRHLRSTTSGCQRLGLAFPIAPTTPRDPAPRGTYPILLAAGERREVRVNSCCMDAGKPCPGRGDRFELASQATPPAVEVALRWWVDHPTAPQGFVNAAIWQGDPSLLERGEGAGSRAVARPVKAVRSYRGVLYVLDDGALTSLDREGVRRFHATGVVEALPGESGLLALAVGASGLDLWRFGETGDPPWMRLFEVGDGVDQVVEGPAGAFALRRGHDVAFRADRWRPEVPVAWSSRSGAEATDVRVVSVDATKGRAVVVVHRKGLGPAGTFNGAQGLHERAPTIEVHDLDLKKGTTALRKTFWNLRDLGGGPAGLFTLTFAGSLARLEGERGLPVPTERTWDAVVAVGAKRLVLRATEGGLFVCDARSGRALALPADAADVSIDPVTDEVVWLADDAVRRFTGPAIAPETFPLR